MVLQKASWEINISKVHSFSVCLTNGRIQKLQRTLLTFTRTTKNNVLSYTGSLLIPSRGILTSFSYEKNTEGRYGTTINVFLQYFGTDFIFQRFDAVPPLSSVAKTFTKKKSGLFLKSLKLFLQQGY